MATSNGNTSNQRRPDDYPNKILLFTILEPMYPITLDVLHSICSPIEKVESIVIFKKNGVQALIQFINTEAATKVKEQLNGTEIYPDCCRLRIQFSTAQKLNIQKNDMESWNYIKHPIIDGRLAEGERLAPLLPRPDLFQRPHPYRVVGGMRGDSGPPPCRPPLFGPHGPGFGLPLGGGGRTVMMVHGLDPPNGVNCDQLFNLFCLYGNVVKIKFLKSLQGCAMIEMDDAISVERCISNLNRVQVGNKFKIHLGFSHQSHLTNVSATFQLPDNTVSFKDFTGSRNNRFIHPSKASKNRLQGPTRVLHFFNTPPTVTREQLLEAFGQKINENPNVHIFPSEGGSNSSSGLLEFESVETALNALMICNHMEINNPDGGAPFTMKLCFSSNRYFVNNGANSS